MRLYVSGSPQPSSGAPVGFFGRTLRWPGRRALRCGHAVISSTSANGLRRGASGTICPLISRPPVGRLRAGTGRRAVAGIHGRARHDRAGPAVGAGPHPSGDRNGRRRRSQRNAPKSGGRRPHRRRLARMRLGLDPSVPVGTSPARSKGTKTKCFFFLHFSQSKEPTHDHH